MGRFSSLFDTKQQEENRKLVQGYIAERARRTEGSVARPASPISNTSPSTQTAPQTQTAPLPAPKTKQYQDRWLASRKFQLSEKQIQQKEKIQAEKNMLSTPARTAPTSTTLSNEALANLQSYQKNTPESNQDFVKGHIEGAKPLVRDSYENTREYQYLNNLSKKPIVGGITPYLGDAMYSVSRFSSGIEGIGNIGEQFMSPEKISPDNMLRGHSSNAVREGSQRVFRNLLGMKYDGVRELPEQITDFVTGTVLDATSSAVNSLLLGRGGLALSAGNAANQEFIDSASNDEITRDQMLLSGLAKGATEVAWEYAPQSRFLEMAKNGLGTTGKEVLKNALKQSGQEFIEEVGTELTNTISDYLIKGKQSDMVQEYLARRQAGESDKEAKFNTAKGIAGNVAMSGLGGALSGGFSTGLAGMSNTVRNGFAYSGMNGTYQDIADSADTSTEEGKAIHEVATRLAEKEAKGQKVSLMDRGYLGNAIDNAAIEASKKAETNNSTLEGENRLESDSVQSGEGNNAPYNVMPNNQTEDSIWEQGGKDVETFKPGSPVDLSNKVSQIETARKSMEQNALHEFSGNYDTEGKQAFMKNYDGSLDLPTYIKAYNDIYNIARYNYKTGHEDLQTGAVKTARMALLSEEQRKEIYKAGFRDLMATEKNWNQNFKERVEKREGGVMDSVPHAPKNLKTVLNALGKNTGLLFRITDSKYADGANGSYEKGKGIITIDLQSDNILGTVSHEMTHWLKDYNEIAYPMFRGHVVESLVRSSGTDFDTLKEAYRNSYGQNMTEEEIIDEIVADATTHFLNDEKFIEEITKDKETKGFAEKILDWIKSVIDAYKELISHTGDRRASLALQEDLKRYEEARELWSYGIEEATQNMQKYEPVTHAEDSETELSQVQLQKVIDDQSDKPIEDRVEDVLTNKNFSDSHIYLNDTPQVLQDLGLRNLPMLMTSKHVYKAIRTEQEAKNEGRFVQRDKGHYHELGKQKFLDVVNALENPELIYKDNNDPNDLQIVVVVGLKDDKNRQIMVAIQPEGNGNYNKVSVDSNVALSMYGRKNLPTKISDAQNDGRILYDKNLNNNSGILQTPVSQLHNNPLNTAVANSVNQYKNLVNNFLQKNGKVQQTNQNNGGNGLLKQLDISEEYYHALEEENSELKKANNYLSEVLNAEKSHVPSQSDVRKTADRMLDEFKSTFKKSDLVEQLTGLYQYLKESKNIDGGEVTRVSRSIAREVIDNAQYQDEDEVREYKAFKGFFDKRPLYIPEEYIEDIYPDGFGALRKKYFGKVDIRKANADHQNNIYDIYRELQHEFPNQFPEHDFTSNDADVALEILDGFEQLRPKDYEHFPGEEYNHAVDRLADEIFNAYFEVGEESLNNKYKKSYKKLKEDARASLEQEYREKYEAKIEKYIAKAEKRDEKSVARIKALRADYKDSLIDYDTFIREEARILKKTGLEYQARRELHQAYREKQDEQRHRQIYKREIVRDSKALMNMAVNPTDNLHVPKVLLKDLVPVLSSVDFSSVNTYDGKIPKISMTANEFARNLETLNRRLTEAEENGGIFTEDDGKGMYLDIDPDLRASLQEVQEAVKGIDGNMNRLSTEQLQTLRNSLRGLKKIVESQNKFISDTLNAKVSEVANEVIKDFESQKTGTAWSGFILGNGHEFLNYNMLDAYSFFHEMGDGGKKVYKLLRAARDKKTVVLNQVENRFKEAMKENHIKTKDITKLSNDTFTFTAHTVRGNAQAEATMTKAQLMSMYLYDLRDQARMHMYGERTDAETGRKHIEEKLGGFKIGDRKKIGRFARDENVYKLTEAEVNALVDEHLTDNEKAFADSIGKILSIDVAKFGNEASNAVYGYDKFTEKNYFPIKVDKDTIDMKNSDLERNMSTLKNKGMTKSLQKEAYNPLIVDDIFEVMMKHVDEMTSYGAYFPAITDMQKFYNMKDETGNSVHRELSRVMGNGGTNYYMNLLRDLNGSRGDTDNVDRFAQGFSGLYKGAKVLGNLRVAIQQPTAYVRALAAIEPQYLMSGLSLPVTEAKKEWELAKKYAPIALWKSMSGSFDINVGKGLRQQMTGEATIRENIANKAGFLLEKGDEFAWKRLWYAAEKKVEGTTDLKKGTEEYYKAAADIFNDIIDKTQVVDSVLNRTDAMKSKNGLVKLSTSFMSEPSKTYNMVYRAYSDYRKGKKNAGAVLGVLAVSVLSAAATAALASVLSAMRDRDKEKKYGERWLDAFVGDFTDNINPIRYIPIMKDFAEIAINAYSGKWNNGSNDLTTKPIADAVKAFKNLSEVMNEDSTLGVVGNLYKASNALDITGIPMSNTLRDGGALYDTIIYDFLDDVSLQYERDKLVYNMEGKNSKGDYVNVKRFLSSALKAYTRGDKALGDKIMAELKAKLGDDVIEEAMQKQLKGNDTIQAMAEKKASGQDYSEDRESLLSQGFSEAMIDKALESAYRKQSPVKKEDLAEQLFEQSEGYKDSLKAYIDYKKADGVSDEKIRSSIKSAVTGRYKEAYQAAIGNPAESDAILKKILRITYEGKRLYTEKDLKQWAKK